MAKNGLGKPFRNKSDHKNAKKSKHKGQNAAFEQIARQRILVQTSFSHLTSQFKWKFTLENHLIVLWRCLLLISVHTFQFFEMNLE